MNRRAFLKCLAWAAVIGAFGAFPVFADEVTAGVAKQVFALPSHVPLAGYSRRHGKPAVGTHDPMGVRALVLRSGDEALALVSCDLLVIDENLFRAVETQLKSSPAFATLTLMIAATHTHSGPGAYGRRFLEKVSMGHYDQRVFDGIAAAIVGAIQSADQARQPVQFACAAGDTQGLIKNRVVEGGFADTQLPVCGVYAHNAAQPLAVLVNFAAHPTTLGAWNKEFSADYPGVVTQALQERFPQAAAFFFAGAVGDQAPVKSGDGFERARFIGDPVAREAAAVLARLKPAGLSRLAVSQEVMKLPAAKVRFGKRWGLPRWFSRRMVDDDATLSVAVIGQSAWFGVPCDLSSALGRQLKEAAASRGLFPVIVGFANDYIGYCMTEQVYQSAEYEALMGFNGPQAGQQVVDRLIFMLDQEQPVKEAHAQ